MTVLGVPGIGKSRLARELVQQVAGATRVAVGRCLAYGEGITYWPLAEVVRATAGTDRDAIASVARDELVADRLAAALGTGGVAGTKEETQWAARRYLEELAADRPLVVVLDDLHWAEPTFLDLVEYVADFASAPLMLLCTARPDLLEVRPAWAAPRANALVLPLEPLSQDHAASLADDVDDAARLRILEIAEGNPLFVEQLVALHTSGDVDSGLPPTLQAVLAARIDTLPASERVVLERGSVEGRLFHRGAVVALAPDDVQPKVGTHLLALVRKEFVRPDRSQVAGDDGYRFAHILVRDAAYDAISKELRADLHERYADWLECIAPERMGELEEILAHHLEQAALYLRELGVGRDDTAHRAADLLARAGTRAHDRGDLPAAANLLGRAAALLPRGDPLRARFAPLWGQAVFETIADAEGARAILRGALEEARRAGDRAAETSVWAMYQILAIQSLPGTDIDFIAGEAAARAPEIEALGDPRALVSLRRLELDIAVHRLVDDVQGAAERLLAAARAAGDRPSALEAVFFLSASAVFGPMPVDEALSWVQRRVKPLAEGPLEETAVTHIEGLLRAMRGDFDDARRIIRTTRGTLAEFGVTLRAVATARDEALIEHYAGDVAAVVKILRPTCDQLRAFGETGILSTEVGELGEALYELGQYGEADDASRESERLGQQADASTQVVWRRVRAKLLARRGDHDEARRLALEAVDWSRTSLETLGDSYRALAEVELLAGRTDHAVEALEQAIGLYERKGIVPMLERTRAQLAGLRAQ